jgi:hypothetical protein
MYSGSSARLGSFVMPLRLSVETWYWSMTHSRAERLPNVSGGIVGQRGPSLASAADNAFWQIASARQTTLPAAVLPRAWQDYLR